MGGQPWRIARKRIGCAGFAAVLSLFALSFPQRAAAIAIGEIDTLAGGSNGDGATATEALLDPIGTAFDAQGNLYIADSANNRVRRVDRLTGIITTVAGNGYAAAAGDGGPATSANLKLPAAVAVDLVGNLYIADRGNQRIRRVDAITGNISTFAGTGVAGFSGDNGQATQAKLNNPSALVIDGDGNLLIADSENNRIRKVQTNGIIRTIAGNGSVGTPGASNGDGGAATSAAIGKPFGLDIDTAGNIFVSEISNRKVRKINTAGVISSFAGNGIWDFCGEGGPALEACLANPIAVSAAGDGYLYIADAANLRVRRVPLTGGNIVTVAGTGKSGDAVEGIPATAALLAGPAGVAWHSTLGLVFADEYNGRVRRIDAAGLIWHYAGNGNVQFGGDGGPGSLAKLDAPNSVAVDSNGNVYIAETRNQRIRKVDTRGIVSTFAGTGVIGFSGDNGSAVNAQLNAPTGVAVDSSNNVYIADSGNHRIRKVSGGIIRTIFGDGSGNSYGDGGPATSAGVVLPAAVDVDLHGNVYVVETSKHKIRRVDANGIVTTFAGLGYSGLSGDGGPANQAALRVPLGVGVDAQGNVFIADAGNHRIRRVDAAPPYIITTFAGSSYGFSGDGGPATSARLFGPTGVAADSDGTIYIADNGNRRIRVVKSDGTIETAAGNGNATNSIDGPGGNPADDLGDGGDALNATLSDPSDIAIDANGNAYLTDTDSDLTRWVFNLSGRYTTGAGSSAIYGAVTYYANGAPVPSASIALQGPSNQSTNTNAAGNFAASGLGAGNWSVIPSKNGGADASSISPLDASYILQAISGLRTFTAEQNLACDVTGNGTLSTLDASLILQHALGMPTDFDAANTCNSDWLFVPVPASAQNQSTVGPRLSTGSCTMGRISYNPLVGQPDGQNFLGILLGDCTGNWGSGGASAAVFAAATSALRTSGAELVLGPAHARGRRVRVPVSIRGDGSLRALQLSVAYDSERLRLVRVRKTAASMDAMLRSRLDQPGSAGIALASGEEIELPIRNLLVLEFVAIERGAVDGIGAVSAAIDEQDVPVRFARQRRR